LKSLSPHLYFLEKSPAEGAQLMPALLAEAGFLKYVMALLQEGITWPFD
jgi:hypothetical protein